MKDILIKALVEAGDIQMRHLNRIHRVEQKESLSSIVTEVDMMCDRHIKGLLMKKFPVFNILTEESGFTRGESEYTWVIDPLDGTSNFAAGIPWFGVLIALFKNNKPVMAGAYIPAEKKLFFAESGKGAYLGNKKIHIENSELSKILFGFSTDYTSDPVLLDKSLFLYRFLIQNSRNIRSTNSMVDLMMVAEGRLGGVVNMFTRIWDIAAPWLIITEAGGDVRFLDGQELIFDLSEDASLVNYPVIAGSFSVLKEFEEKIKKNNLPGRLSF